MFLGIANWTIPKRGRVGNELMQIDLTFIVFTIILSIIANLLTLPLQARLPKLLGTWRKRNLESQERYLATLTRYKATPTEFVIYLLSVNLAILVSLLALPLLLLLAGMSYGNPDEPLALLVILLKVFFLLAAIVWLLAVLKTSIDAMATLVDWWGWDKTKPRIEKIIKDMRDKQAQGDKPTS